METEHYEDEGVDLAAEDTTVPVPVDVVAEDDGALSDPPEAPQRAVLAEDDPMARLVEGVTEALHAVPLHFESKTVIEGIEAGDLFALNSVLGGTIEIQAVEALNRLRAMWDPNDELREYGFVRSNQTFPDVRLLKNTRGGPEPILGIELKGWYLLSKEGEPSFRYKATPEASSKYDLIAVYPWHLTNLLSGTPVLLEPFVEQSRYAAQMRNFYWEHQRGKTGESVIPPKGDVAPYPGPKTKISDSVRNDSPGNFGRLARSHGLMSGYCQRMLQELVVGIPARDWITFMKRHTDLSDAEQVHAKLVKGVKTALKIRSTDVATELVDGFVHLMTRSSPHLPRD